MNKPAGPLLAPFIADFFCQRLQGQQQVSPNTLASYRDTLRLLLCFVQAQAGTAPSQQTLADWDAPAILRFLEHLQKERGCQARTRNVRLAAVRAFMRYLAQQAPETVAVANRVLAIPMKRLERLLVAPLSVAEVQAILQAADSSTQSGQRDHLLFNLLYHTGARISEALRVRHRDIALGPPSTICFHGKGRKMRTIPLLKPIAQELKRTLSVSAALPDTLVFQNRFGRPLSRWGIGKRLRQAVRRAAQHCSTLEGRIVSPHTFRHTTAMQLLQAGVDIATIALLLGHESPATTHHYIELDLQMKERCLRKLRSPKMKTSRFEPSDSLLKLLESY